ncbi:MULTISPECIES: phosphoadenosine phosphosulfate reductase domain-containing protein [Acinetobacter]|uniref:Phosphoadenosine phosphosulfate reductase n=1 Tax=Acinetobacter genomosp. 15BJ TaxID=106651 RepID=R9B5U1_9GAMM|nr:MULTISPECIES: phosphoadenosine phosphosulfate reductase family protein [Acinetobacter]EOR09808.1 phosphoadenosine phosphosulfate reductase [Acinetobacter genomosp. 15BJ]MCH7292073.1 phosphoadenosine phosphosulfate reductase family protein [Acinetobacter genomosp. 15BJ]MCI3879916.1 phosphoadenosine phosphosulfate reductase family protein [Acinetobacter higginsii]MDO3656884.1 phosphoadenosine phosphosulfate reductase family protein [Acinetobacter genomosp. 15BJ]
MTLNLDQINTEFGNDAEKLVEWALSLNEKAIVTTNFRPFEAVILHMLTRVKPDIQVVWMDNGYNTETTYKYVDEITKLLNLNLLTYLPKRSRAHREALEGPVPALDDPKHEAFTAEVKLEPFERALRETAPKVWFTALRATDTAVRAEMDPVSLNPDGLIKVAPLLKWTSKDLWEYMQKHNLPDNEDYFDPTKGEEHRECGLHLNH